jgi:hypothetical protein
MIDEEVAPIQGYLRSQAAKLTILQLVDKLRTDAWPLRAAAGAMAPGRFRERPAAGEWSAAEVWTHVLDMSEHGVAAVLAMIAGERPRQVADRISGGERAHLRGPDDYWREFERGREQFYAEVLGARGDEHLDVALVHPTFGPLNWREWMLFMRVHDLDHLRQLQAIAALFGT